MIKSTLSLFVYPLILVTTTACSLSLDLMERLKELPSFAEKDIEVTVAKGSFPLGQPPFLSFYKISIAKFSDGAIAAITWDKEKLTIFSPEGKIMDQLMVRSPEIGDKNELRHLVVQNDIIYVLVNELDVVGNNSYVVREFVAKYSRSGQYLGLFKDFTWNPGDNPYSFQDFSIDSSGNMYGLSNIFLQIYKFAPNGNLVQTFSAGSGAAEGSLMMPRALSAANDGSVWVADMPQYAVAPAAGLGRLQRFNADGSFDKAYYVTATEAFVDQLELLPDGNLLFSQRFSNNDGQIVKVNGSNGSVMFSSAFFTDQAGDLSFTASNGKITAMTLPAAKILDLSTGATLESFQAELNTPVGTTFSANSHFFVSNLVGSSLSDSSIIVFDNTGKKVNSFAAGTLFYSLEFSAEGDLYGVDLLSAMLSTGPATLKIYSAINSNHTNFTLKKEIPLSGLSQGLALNKRKKNLLLADVATKSYKVYDLDGEPVMNANNQHKTLGAVSEAPGAVTILPDNGFVALNTGAMSVLTSVVRFNSEGNKIWELDGTDVCGGASTAPAIVSDYEGDIYVLCNMQYRIVKIKLDGSSHAVHIQLSSAENPVSMKIDGGKYLFVSDTMLSRVNKFDKNGNIEY